MTGTVCVVGASFAGIPTAKVFLNDGFDVTVYEKSDEVGGTWSSSRRYVNLNNQMEPGTFELIDKPWGSGYTPAEEMQAYLREYATEFDVLDLVEFETEVVDVASDGDDWVVETRSRNERGDPTVETHRFDYVVVCSGAYDRPNVAEFPGRASFEGEVYHSSELGDADRVADEDVAVVGCGTSAVDVATESARVADSTTMVFRRPHWLLPKKLWGVLPRRWFVYTRLGEALLPRYYNEETWRLPDRIPATVKRWYASLLEHGIATGAGYDELPDELVPEQSPLVQRPRGVMADDFVPFVRSGRIEPRNDPVERFRPEGLELESGERVDADVVVVATGYDHEYPFLSDDVRLKNDDGQFALYRGIVPPETDGLGIVGRREVFNNFLSMNLSAHWLSDYFRGELVEMPTTEEMRESVRRRLSWMDEAVAEHRGYFFGPYHFHTYDELLLDMGVSTRRRSNLVAEWLGPNARARAYDGLGDERASDRD